MDRSGGCQLGFLYLLAKNPVLEKLFAAYLVALHLSLTLKIQASGQQASKAFETETESHYLLRLRLCDIRMVKDTVGLNSANILLKRCLNLLTV